MGLKQAHPVIRHLYFWLNYGFFIGAPVLTSSLVLSLIGDLADQLRCRIYSGGTCCVFSELNENTLRLAEKIREKYRKELMVFCNTRETPKELRARAKATGAVLLYAPAPGQSSAFGISTCNFTWFPPMRIPICAMRRS